MTSRVFTVFSFATALALPLSASAAEPSKGTVVTIASIGAWVIISSVGIVLRRKRVERQTPDAAAKTDANN